MQGKKYKKIDPRTKLLPSEEQKFQTWRKGLPSNLQSDDSSYDLRGAYKGGLTPELYEDGSYHMGTRVPSTGKILKSPNHPTYKMGLEEDMKLGYVPQVGKDGNMYTKNIMKEPQFKKGTKKITKASNGLQLVDDAGQLTRTATQLGGGLSAIGAMGIEGLTKSKYDPKYTSQLKDENQATGRAIGAAAGMALNLVAPGLGTIASPLLSSAGGALQRSFQANKLESLKKEGEFKDKVAKTNENIGTDLTSFQAKQYKEGGTVKPYVAKNAKDYKTRKQAYDDSLFYHNAGKNLHKEYKGLRWNKVSNDYVNNIHKKAYGDNWESKDKIKPINYTEYTVPNDAPHYIGNYKKPVQKVLPPEDKTLGKLAPKVSTIEPSINAPSIPEKLETIKPKGYKRVSKPSSVPGYGQMREYNKFVQEPIYSKGTKVIEIEGKKTPEIHTDANFNVKNLGTTPHSKGGNKVLAEEGDVVFPTQNSPKKYNEIMNAIMKKDKYKLKKEQSKLPEDKSKYATGGTVSGETPAERLARLRSKTKNNTSTRDKSAENVRNLQSGLWGGISNWVKETNANNQNYKKGFNSLEKGYEGLTVAEAEELKALEKSQSSGTVDTSSRRNVSPSLPEMVPSNMNAQGWISPNMRVPSIPAKSEVTTKTTSKGSGRKKQWSNPNSEISPIDTPTIEERLKVDSNFSVPEKLEEKNLAPVTPANSDGSYGKGYTKNLSIDGNQAMELLPIAYNLGQGLFGKTEKVNRREYKPQMENYVDTSNPMRREISGAEKVAKANARNLSGGNSANFRANSQSASNQKLAQMNAVDTQEYQKQLDVNNRNLQTGNNAKLTNLGLQNQYDELDAMNRAKKSEALSQGMTELGQLGARNTLAKNNLQATLINADAIKRQNYGGTPTTEGTQITDWNSGFLGGAGTPSDTRPTKRVELTGNLFPSLGVGRKSRVPQKSKGSKSINVERKYKLKN